MVTLRFDEAATVWRYLKKTDAQLKQLLYEHHKPVACVHAEHAVLLDSLCDRILRNVVRNPAYSCFSGRQSFQVESLYQRPEECEWHAHIKGVA